MTHVMTVALQRSTRRLLWWTMHDSRRLMHTWNEQAHCGSHKHLKETWAALCDVTRRRWRKAAEAGHLKTSWQALDPTPSLLHTQQSTAASMYEKYLRSAENIGTKLAESRSSSGNGGHPFLTLAPHYTSTQRAISAAAYRGTNTYTWKQNLKRICED